MSRINTYTLLRDTRKLKMISEPVPHGEDVSELIAGMWDIMSNPAKPGVGLAAPQVDVFKRVIVVKYGAVCNAIINPVIGHTKRGKMVTSLNEGCLSFPGRRVNVKRHKRVIIEGFDVNWQPLRIDARNFLAFVMQHEIDHLNGVTII